MRRAVLAAIVGTLLAGSSSRAVDQAALSDEQTIRGVFEVGFPRLYAGTDARAIAALWTDPATHGGMVEGRRPRAGHAEIEQMWSAGFAARPKDYSRRLSVVVSSLQFVAADLAAVDAVLMYTGGTRPDGSVNPPSKELLFAVVIRKGAEWKILASRVAPVQSTEPGR